MLNLDNTVWGYTKSFQMADMSVRDLRPGVKDGWESAGALSSQRWHLMSSQPISVTTFYHFKSQGDHVILDNSIVILEDASNEQKNKPGD